MPLAYQLGAGVGPLPLPGRERIELLLSIGVALYAVASLIMLRLSRGDSAMMLALFAAQFLLPSVFTRLVFAVVFWVVAIDILWSERAAAAAAADATLAAQCGRQVGPVADAAVRERGHQLEPRNALAARRQEERLDVDERVADRHDARGAEDRAADAGRSRGRATRG